MKESPAPAAVDPDAHPGRNRVLTLSTISFTVMFAVWLSGCSTRSPRSSPGTSSTRPGGRTRVIDDRNGGRPHRTT